MIFVALLSLAFSAWIGWTLVGSVREKKPSGWRDWLGTSWMAGGSLAGIVVAIVAALKAVI